MRQANSHDLLGDSSTKRKLKHCQQGAKTAKSNSRGKSAYDLDRVQTFFRPEMQTVQLTVNPDQLLLDPNNYRFHDLPEYRSVPTRARYAEAGVQERALQLLQRTEAFELNALKDSIRSNGYVPIEQIVVEKFDDVDGVVSYLVVEGNRRTAAVKGLLREQHAGSVDLPQPVLDSISNLPVIELIGTPEERNNYQQTLMAIRHIAGIREWGPYQQAKLVVELYERNEESFGAVAQQIGISSREVARRYRASKALQQMEEDDEFGEFATPRLYTFFHEAVSQPKVREWLNFSDTTYRAENADARRSFYELLSPRNVDGEMLPPKLNNATRQVRQLKEIVDKPVPLRILLDPERSFEDAVRAADDESLPDETGILEHSLGVAVAALRQPSIETWLNPTERSKQLWTDLVAVVDSVRRILPVNN
ncbi:hypothetical protein GCM10010985_45760 [Caballeronia grimmiae]|nr:hypothetical protein GCM10010985_45760 [Caballeronia grimmiae]